MNITKFIEALNAQDITHSQNVLCSSLSSFRIGGTADLVAEPKNVSELKYIIEKARGAGVLFLVVGKGSNLLFPDDGYRGVIIKLGRLFSAVELTDDTTIRVEAGAELSVLCNFAATNGLTGLEFAYGIPGSVSGGIFMNAGAYGGELCDVVTSATVLEENGELVTYSAKDLGFSYRHSKLMENGGILVEAQIKLSHGDEQKIRSEMKEIIEKRKSKQPLEYPSVGSTFKRPVGGFASALIDECGLKGKSVGGACVSEKHAGFVINKGGATAKDVLMLCEIIKDTVLREKGILLELEVQVINCTNS